MEDFGHHVGELSHKKNPTIFLFIFFHFFQ